MEPRPNEEVALVYHDGSGERACVLPRVQAQSILGEQFVPLEQGMLVGVHQADCSRYFVVRLADAACIATLEAPAGLTLGVREQPGHLLLHGADGRLLDVDLALSLAHPLTLQ